MEDADAKRKTVQIKSGVTPCFPFTTNLLFSLAAPPLRSLVSVQQASSQPAPQRTEQVARFAHEGEPKM